MFSSIKKKKEKREELERYMSALYPHGDIVRLQKQIDDDMAKLRIRSEIQERIFGVFKIIIFVPLIKIFDLCGFITKILLGASAFTFLYGLFLCYKYFINGAMVDTEKMIVLLIAPFALSFLAYFFGTLAESMESRL